MFFDTTGIGQSARRQTVEGILTDLALRPATVAGVSNLKAVEKLDSPVLCVVDEERIATRQFRNAWAHLSAHQRHLYTIVCLSGSGRASTEWDPDVALKTDDGSVYVLEVKSFHRGPGAKNKQLKYLRHWFSAVIARRAPDAIRTVDYAPADDVLWVEFGDGLRRAFPWKELPFGRKDSGLRPGSVRPSEHRDAIVFDSDHGEIDVDAAALRGLADPRAGAMLDQERRGSLARFGERLQALRSKKGVTQEGLAQASGLPQPSISRIENGEREPRLATLEKYALGLGMSVAELMLATAKS